MRRYGAMIRAVCIHKYWVLCYCLRLGIPWLGIIHDLSKFSLLEFRRYALTFFSRSGAKIAPDGNGGYDPSEQTEWFLRAFLHHQRNRHHWQAWVALGRGDTLTPLRIPDKYCREMIADWLAAHKLDGGSDLRAWYHSHSDKILLHPATKRRIHELLKYTAEWLR